MIKNCNCKGNIWKWSAGILLIASLGVGGAVYLPRWQTEREMAALDKNFLGFVEIYPSLALIDKMDLLYSDLIWKDQSVAAVTPEIINQYKVPRVTPGRHYARANEKLKSLWREAYLDYKALPEEKKQELSKAFEVWNQADSKTKSHFSLYSFRWMRLSDAKRALIVARYESIKSKTDAEIAALREKKHQQLQSRVVSSGPPKNSIFRRK